MNDPAEREADQVAAQVVRQLDHPVGADASADTVARESIEDEELLQGKRMPQTIARQGIEEEELLQGSRTESATVGAEGGALDAATSTSIDAARGNGRPMPDAVRGSMEQAFGADFSSVGVHTDSRADSLNSSLQARAFTIGSDIFFRKGDFQPETRAGRELLAHELTHVVQQGGA